MRVAVVSDVHGSLVALEAVIADLRGTAPDVVVHGGDLVVNGPKPNDVVAVIRELGWAGVVGNTDEMLWKLDDLDDKLSQMPRLAPLLTTMYEHTAPAALERLSTDNLGWLKQLPADLDIDGTVILHASPNNLWRAPAPDASDEELASTYEALQGRVVIYGHIHRPFVRKLENTFIANSGSVGLTWDGDPRASYLIVDDGVPEVVRVEYDVEKEVAPLSTERFPYSEWLAEMRRQGRFVRPDDFEP